MKFPRRVNGCVAVWGKMELTGENGYFPGSIKVEDLRDIVASVFTHAHIFQLSYF